MQPEAPSLRDQVFAEQLSAILDAVADQPYPTPDQRASARQAAVLCVTAYNPRDPVETTIAGQCVIYDHLLRDGARDLLRGQSEAVKLKARPSLLSCGKMFLASLEMLMKIQGRVDTELAFARRLPMREETPAELVAATEQPLAAAPDTPGEEASDEAVEVVSNDAREMADQRTPPVAPEPAVTNATPSTGGTTSGPATVRASFQRPGPEEVRRAGDNPADAGLKNGEVHVSARVAAQAEAGHASRQVIARQPDDQKFRSRTNQSAPAAPA
jgi:hypothetical protein